MRKIALRINRNYFNAFGKINVLQREIFIRLFKGQTDYNYGISTSFLPYVK